jgi:hypothetical protein
VGDVTHNTSHVAQGLALPISQFRGKPRFIAILTAHLNQIQDIEDAFYDLLTLRLQQGAVGAQVDVLGRIVGQPRLWTDDTEYLRYIGARVKVNRSVGRLEELLQILVLILGGSAVIRSREYYPASAVIEVTDVTVNARIMVEQFVRKARAAGVNLQVIYTSASAAAAFTLADANGATTTGAGYGDSVAGLAGGVLTGVAV